MPFLSFFRDERVVFTGLGLATISVASFMAVIMSLYRDETKITTTPPKSQYITQETEDALKLTTLDNLLGHYNYSIRETASRIVSDRAANDGTTIDYLLYGITRPDYDERMKCLKTLAFITDPQNLRVLHTKKVAFALVRSLELSLDDVEHEKLDDKYWDEYYIRDMAERLCLMFVSQLMSKYDTRLLVEAGFVEKWLAKQKWGDTEEERQHNYRDFVEYKGNRLQEICISLQRSRDGLRALERAHLVSRARAADLASHPPSRVSVILEISMPNGEESVELTVDEASVTRTVEQSSEEQRVRRQHREAMVLNDGTRPFRLTDIIERNRESPP